MCCVISSVRAAFRDFFYFLEYVIPTICTLYLMVGFLVLMT